MTATDDEELDPESSHDRTRRLQEQGQAVRAARLLRGYATQADLSLASGIPQAQISRYESGVRDMFMATARRLAETLNLSVDQLLGSAPLPAAHRDEAAIERDPYPNRRRLRRLPEFASAPAWVKEVILGSLHSKGDLTFFEWVDELKVFLAMHARGESLEAPRDAASEAKPRGKDRRRG